ncbi:hypothetical protein [Capillimicrobium parvum]|nr:hypothetical protein [Capillimicrobium parvum]
MSPRTLARTMAIGRIAIGGALVIAPAAVARRWIGADGDRESVQVMARALGVRDLVLGLIALHTLDHSEVGPRWQRTLAACDLVDLTATVVGRNALPAAGAAGTVALAGGAAAVELWAAGKLG